MTVKAYSPGYSADDECLTCGEHLSAPHAVGCPAATADNLRDHAAASDQAHLIVLAGGGYPRSDYPRVSHKFFAAARRVAAELVENDQLGAIDLDQWDSGTEFIAYLTGEANQFD